MLGVTETPDVDFVSAPQFGGSPSDQGVDAGDIESMNLPVVRRGFDPAEVRARLQAAASEIRRLQRLCDELTGRMNELSRADRGGSDARRVTEMLGVEVSGVLEAAHEAATSTIQRAESEAEAMSQQARSAAEAVLADATAQSSELVEAARLEADEIVEESRNHGREMVHEAQTVRERILRDLARKRQTGRTQIEQLRAGRDRLLEALSTVQTNLDAAVEDLVTSVPEARSAANRAGLRISSEPTPTVEDLEAEIEAGRLVDHPLVSDSPIPGPIGDTFTTGEMEALDHLDALSAGAGETDTDEHDVDETDVDETGVDETGVDETGVDETGVDETGVDETHESESVETEPEPEAEPDELGEPEDPDPSSEIESATEAEPEPEVVAEAGRDEPTGRARDVFARLRRSKASAEPKPEAQPHASPTTESVAEPSQEILDQEVDASSDPVPAGDPPADPADDVRERAAFAAAKAMKRVLVEEQGSLLDGIRRSGADAVASLEEEQSHNSCYDEAATPALREQCITLGGTSDLDLTLALANIHVIALEPVRRRLADIAEQFDSEEELSDAVRALYREVRSRNLNEAASAASVAVDGLVKIDRAHNDKATRTVRWVVDPGGSCGADCADNALAGEVTAGEKFPTGDRFPPAHPGCRCRIEVA